jgi:broad specificity phosphatase PhoE
VAASDEDDPLTEYGRHQAQRLGTEWKDVHIDALKSSPLQRAHHMAHQIAKNNHDTTLEVTTDNAYEERRMGQAAIDASCAGNHERARALYTGFWPGESGVPSCSYLPPGGGESSNGVARRARMGLTALLLKYGKELDEPPKEFLDKTVINSPNVLPEGIPHVVVVSHNVFLSELYESLFRWNSPYHMTTCEYGNTDW